MDPTPPTADGVAQRSRARQGAARTPPPATPFAKPASRGFVAIVAIVLAGVTGLAWLDARNGAGALRSEVAKRLADEEAALAQAKARDSDQTGDLREAHAKLALLETRMAELQSQQASLEAQYQRHRAVARRRAAHRSRADAVAREPAARAGRQRAGGARRAAAGRRQAGRHQSRRS